MQVMNTFVLWLNFNITNCDEDGRWDVVFEESTN